MLHRISWKGSDDAGGYRVWSRDINDKGSKLDVVANVTESTCNEEYLLFPGVWNFAFAVSAFNGDGDESDPGPESIAPSPSGAVASDFKCPPKESWCPQGAHVSVPPGPTTTASGPAPTDTTIPIVTNGYCGGPDCKDGQCSGLSTWSCDRGTGD